MEKVTVLVQVVRRYTMEALLPVDVIEIKRHARESDLLLEIRAREQYFAIIQREIQYTKLRNKMNGVDWTIDSVIVE